MRTDFLEEARKINRILGLRALAEKELESAGEADPDDLLPHLLPSPSLLAMDEEVGTKLYRHHVTELSHRATTREPMSLGTLAEILVGLHEASLIRPLNSDGLALMAHVGTLLGVWGRDESVPKPDDHLLPQARTLVKTGRPKRAPKRRRKAT